MDEHKGHNTEQVVSEETGKAYIVCHDCKKTLGRVTEVYSRIVGYLRPVSNWNKGKKAEFKQRKTFLNEPKVSNIEGSDIQDSK